jgi:hypothetical protein
MAGVGCTSLYPTPAHLPKALVPPMWTLKFPEKIAQRKLRHHEPSIL